MLADQDQPLEGLEMECTALKKACVACQDEVGPLCPATARPRRTRGKRRGLGCGGNKDHGRKRGGGFVTVKQRGGGLWVHHLLVGLLMVVVCGLRGVEGFVLGCLYVISFAAVLSNQVFAILWSEFLQ